MRISCVKRFAIRKDAKRRKGLLKRKSLTGLRVEAFENAKLSRAGRFRFGDPKREF